MFQLLGKGMTLLYMAEVLLLMDNYDRNKASIQRPREQKRKREQGRGGRGEEGEKVKSQQKIIRH